MREMVLKVKINGCYIVSPDKLYCDQKILIVSAVYACSFPLGPVRLKFWQETGPWHRKAEMASSDTKMGWKCDSHREKRKQK